MTQRLIKIIVPLSSSRKAQNLIDKKLINYWWLEHENNNNSVINILTDAGSSEKIIDSFQKIFAASTGFRLIILPVEASLPVKKKRISPDYPDDKQKSEKEKSRISREELYVDIYQSVGLSKTYIAMTVLSTIVAAAGLLKDNTAVIIGAMVIAPFLGPNVALAFSSTLADFKLGYSALKTLAAGLLTAFIVSFFTGFFLGADPSVESVYSRTLMGFSDIILAIASGSAGVLAFTSGVSGAVIGVMVAVALLPPLAVCGILAGGGFYDLSLNALILLFTNIACINLAGIITFYIQGIRPWKSRKEGIAKRTAFAAFFIWTCVLAFIITMIFFTG
ncbi:MAG: TIGR00341 family protein [Bacteroidota bacterium]